MSFGNFSLQLREKKIDHLKNANIQVYKLDAENRRKSKIKQENIKEKRMYIFNNY